MTLFADIPRRVLQDSRDHIMIITESGNITTLCIRYIQSVSPSPLRNHAVVRLQIDGAATSVTIQERASAFQDRCQKLLEAVEWGDAVLIHQYYCPKRPSD